MKKSLVRLTLALNHDCLEGNPACGYEFEALVNALGEILFFRFTLRVVK